MGEQGTKLYLIRKGQVCVLRPPDQPGGSPTTLAVLGRGHFVGERTLVTGKYETVNADSCNNVLQLPLHKLSQSKFACLKSLQFVFFSLNV